MIAHNDQNNSNCDYYNKYDDIVDNCDGDAGRQISSSML